MQYCQTKPVAHGVGAENGLADDFRLIAAQTAERLAVKRFGLLVVAGRVQNGGLTCLKPCLQQSLD